MAYEGYNGQVEIDGEMLVITRTGIVARAAFGKDVPPRYIPLRAVSGVRLKEASRLGNGWIQLLLGGIDQPAPSAGTAASDPNVVLFTRGKRDAFGPLHEWLVTVIEHNQLHDIDPAGVDFDAGQSRQVPSPMVAQGRAEQKQAKQAEQVRAEQERAVQTQAKQAEQELLESSLRHTGDEFADEVSATESVTTTLEKTIKLVSSQTKELREQMTTALKPRKLRAVGLLKRVVLYDTVLSLPGQRVPLTPHVHAMADNQGNKQVVQGWVFRSTNDRREMMLQVEWPGGYQAVQWERNDKALTGSDVLPEEVHSMAGAINIAAAASPKAHQAMRDRRLDVNSAMKQHLLNADQRIREQLESADERLAVLATLIEERKQNTNRGADKRFTKRLDREIRSAAKVHAALAKVAIHGRTFLDVSRQDGESVEKDLAPGEVLGQLGQLLRSHLARREAEESSALNRQMHEPSAAIPSGDPIAILEQIARLRDNGILTQEEFDAKKAEILRRL